MSPGRQSFSRSRSRGRSKGRSYSTPVSNKRQRTGRSMSISPDTIDSLVSVALTPIVGSTAAQVAGTAARVAAGGKKISRSRAVSRAGAYFGGKVNKFKRNKKSMSKRGKLTKPGLHTIGVHSRQEIGMTNAGTEGNRVEVAYIGHTSMPLKQTALQIWRAIVKALMLRHQIFMQDFTQKLVSFGLAAGDAFTVAYYADGEAILVSTFTYLVDPNSSFEDVAMNLSNSFGGIGDVEQIRLHAISFVPTAGKRINLDLHNASIVHHVKSALKVQNRTVTTTGENEADDVDNCPINGKAYHIKGNNLLLKSNRRLLSGIGTTADLRRNEVILYGGSVGVGADIANDGIAYGQANSTNSQFAKPAEVPHPYEVEGCYKYAKVRINPGAIQTSILEQRYELNLQYLLKLLYAGGDDRKYNKKAGLCRVFALDKAIVDSTSDVKIAAEVQCDMWTMLKTKQSLYTAPITYQSLFKDTQIEA